MTKPEIEKSKKTKGKVQDASPSESKTETELTGSIKDLAQVAPVPETPSPKPFLTNPAALKMLSGFTAAVQSQGSRTSNKATIWNRKSTDVLTILQDVFVLKDDSGISRTDLAKMLFSPPVKTDKGIVAGIFHNALTQGQGVPGVVRTLIATEKFNYSGQLTSLYQKMRVPDSWFFQYEQVKDKNGKLEYYASSKVAKGVRKGLKPDFQKRLNWILNNFDKDVSTVKPFELS